MRCWFVISGLLLGGINVLCSGFEQQDATAAKRGAQVDEPTGGDEDSESRAGSESADAASADFRQAGVCARCHVVSVLEWSFSGHVAASTNCEKCHGPSRGHVENERNEVKPDRLPRGDAIAGQLCATCHETGCPETLQVTSCQTCHHVHALVNPSKPPEVEDDRLARLLTRWADFQERMAEGEQHLQRTDWDRAQQAFRAALDLIPGNHLARRQLEICRRRLSPEMPGFDIVGDLYDDQTGLPRKVEVEGLETPMLLVSPGEFDMGSDLREDARPEHSVPVAAFYLGQYEVTQAEWLAIMETNPSQHQGGGFDTSAMPVERVSWQDCQEFLRRLNARVAGGGFRLPTEAEWEYACRAGGSPLDPNAARQPAEPLGELAWYRDNSRRGADAAEPFLQIEAFAPHPIGMRRPNAWGFYDLQGNVSEWCSSLYRDYLYDPTDGRELLEPLGLRVIRGGSYADQAAALHPAARHADRPHRRFRWNGLRLARSVPEVAGSTLAPEDVLNGRP